VVSGVAVVVVLAVGGPFVYIHFVEGPAPAKLTLPKGHAQTGPGSPAATGPVTGTSSAEGTWNVGPGSIVGYRVNEVLLGQHTTAVGRTREVWGSLEISGTSVTKGSFTAEMGTVLSDQSERNAQFDGPIMDVSTFPTATFTLTSPIKLGSVPPDGKVERFPATGDLAMHGETKPVTFTVSAERSASSINALTDVQIVFASWGIANPSIGGFVTTQSSGVLEVLLDLTRGTGNPAVKGPPGVTVPQGPPGGQVTVPRTTVPPLSVTTATGHY
jgi:polyisoprenoid-binding protein YceI